MSENSFPCGCVLGVTDDGDKWELRPCSPLCDILATYLDEQWMMADQDAAIFEAALDCPYCLASLRGFVSAEFESSEKISFVVCVYCFQIAVRDELGLAPATDEQQCMIDRNASLQDMLNAVKTFFGGIRGKWQLDDEREPEVPEPVYRINLPTGPLEMVWKSN